MYRVYYGIDFLDIICHEDFDTKEDMNEWIESHPRYEVIDIAKGKE